MDTAAARLRAVLNPNILTSAPVPAAVPWSCRLTTASFNSLRVHAVCIVLSPSRQLAIASCSAAPLLSLTPVHWAKPGRLALSPGGSLRPQTPQPLQPLWCHFPAPSSPGRSWRLSAGPTKTSTGGEPLILTNLQISKCQKGEEEREAPGEGRHAGNGSVWARRLLLLTTPLRKWMVTSGQQQRGWLRPRGILLVKRTRAAGSSQLKRGPHSSDS